jgi:plasmid stabilization system protein ParE
MSYTVVFVPSAEGQLAAVWTASANRRAVTLAADRIDQLLGTAPAGVGESRGDRFRVLIELPLTVYYEVHEADRRVLVLRVVGR